MNDAQESRHQSTYGNTTEINGSSDGVNRYVRNDVVWTNDVFLPISTTILHRNLQSNALTGTLPNWIADLKKLRSL